MRMLLRVSIPVEAGNAAPKAGTLGSTVEKTLADLKRRQPTSSRTTTATGQALSCST